MTSQINPNNIDGNYPVAGVSNNTQGMRDNFTNTKTNFQYAADEITELQQKAILKSAITGTTLDNNMNDNLLYAVQLRDVSYTSINVAATAGTVTLDYAAGMYQQINTTGSINLAFTNWPVSGTVGTLQVSINITNTAHTVTLPAAVSQGLVGLQGVSPGTPGVTNVITFGQTGNFVFEFFTSNAGETIYIVDQSRARTAITANTVSTSTTTGALTVTGGVGIGGNLYVGGGIVGNIVITGISITGNVTAGNVITSGTVFGNVSSDMADVANLTANNLSVTTLSAADSTTVSVISETSFYEQVFVDSNLVVSGNISPAAPNKIGGIKPGPGVDISNTGLLTIDSANLAFSFGNFTANNNILTIVNSDEDMILATQGNAEIQLVGNIGFYKSNGLPPDPNNQYFFARDDGQLRILVPVEDPVEGGVEIIGSATGNYVTPGASGTMLQLTGNPDVSCRVYHDSLREYSSYVARRYNGTTASPGQVLAGQDVFRINVTAATDAGMGNVSMCQIRFTALENQTTTAQGSEISFYVTPVGSPASSRIEVANITVANGVSATQFTTAGNVTATGNVTSGNIITAGAVSATGSITSSGATAGIGYRTGAGGTVTQLTSKSTAVTLNTVTGEITMNGALLGGDATVSFTLNNSAIANTDVIILNQVGGGNIGLYAFNGACNTGSAQISVHNMTNTNRSDAIVLRFAVIKAATS